jgi:magnesium chelatase subunit H
MQKRITAADVAPIGVTIITLDGHLSGAIERAKAELCADVPGLRLSLHVAGDWHSDPRALAECLQAIATSDIILVNMLFMEEHIAPVLPALKARRDSCDAMIGCIASSDIVKLTRLGRLSMDEDAGGALAILKRLRPKRSGNSGNAALSQMRMLRRIPKLLKYIPGPAQDLRAYFLIMQYWLSGSDENICSLIRYLVDRYADGSRRALRGTLAPAAPVSYPEVGLYHPRLPDRMTDVIGDLRRVSHGNNGTVGLLLMRSYLLAGNAAHYDAVIAAFESRGLTVVPAFASSLDARPAIEQYFIKDGRVAVDAVVSLTGFSLVGGPAYNDAAAAEQMLARLDVPYIAALPVEFQSLEQWKASDQGLLPVEATIMVAIPELDGATGSIVFGGRSEKSGAQDRDMRPETDRIARLVARTEKLIALRKSERAERRLAVVIFGFPPNAGSVGTAAFLSVFESLHATLHALRGHGYSVDVPASVEALRTAILQGNAELYGTNANVHTRISVDDHIRDERWLDQIEAQWGPAPGRHQSTSDTIHVLGARFGNVFVGVQPAFGYEGDPMRLLFEKGFAPTHAFSAFYRWIGSTFGAHAILHFGTHGALEFMPGKQAGLSADCWPDRLIGDIPNFYLYAANNPSEGTLAKRRSAATLVSYLTPPVTSAGLYRGLVELKSTLDQWRGMTPHARAADTQLLEIMQAQAANLGFAQTEPAWSTTDDEVIDRLRESVLEVEYALIPHGLHIVGRPMSRDERRDVLRAMLAATETTANHHEIVDAILSARTAADIARIAPPADAATRALIERLVQTNSQLAEDHEIDGLLNALDGNFVRPSPSGDLLSTPEILPTGRNIHGFDPFRIPSAFAMKDGERQAARILERHMDDGNNLPETVALVLWGTDNLKSGGAPIAQALALMGARARFDTYGRLAGAELIPLSALGRPRIDVAMTTSGIFRDLLPLQIKLLAEAAYLAATADEPIEKNFVRKHALELQRTTGCDLETATLRVFSNAEGAYGANVNHLIESSRWDDAKELADVFSRRKGFAYSRHGRPTAQPALLQSILAQVDLAYQNLESVELGVTTIDTYFDTLGGIAQAVTAAKGSPAPVYVSDQTRGEGRVRTLDEQISLETRTRILNPKWYEGMLKHGHEGVRHIEAHVSNTVGWSATTGSVAPWVYGKISETFILDPAMRERLSAMNPTSSLKIANRLLEAQQRKLWEPDPETLASLQKASEELEDRLEGLTPSEVLA